MADKNNTFTYTTTDGEKITLLKQAKAANPGFLRKNRKASDEDRMWLLIERAADEENLAIIDELDNDDFTALMEAWAEDSGVELGESKAS